MLTIESATNGRKGILRLLSAIVLGAAAACFIVLLGGIVGIALGSVCGAIGLGCGVAGLVANWKQSKEERDAALAYHQSGTAKHTSDIMDKVVDASKSVSKEETKEKEQTKDKDNNSVSATNKLNKIEIYYDPSAKPTEEPSSDTTKEQPSDKTKIISKILKADGTTSIIEGPLNEEAAKNLKFVRKVITTKI